MQIWLNGNMVARDDANINVFDHGLLYGDGIFEGIRIYNGGIFQCDAHLDRLFRSAEMIRLVIGYTKDELRAAMEHCIQANGLTDGYIRLVVTRGVGNLGIDPFLCKKSSTFIIADSIQLYSEEMYATGIAVIISKTLRTHSSMLPPETKSLNYLNNILAKIEAVDAGVPETLMCNQEGYIAEASADNVFIVKDGAILTPPPNAGILLGITRSVVIYLAGTLGIKCSEENIMPQDVLEADECFLTGTGAEVIAVTKVDDQTLGNGTAGPITQKILAAFREFILTDKQIPYTE
ncbi:MAG: branched-chain-amino-acid transaminase [Phycisphaerae bacterium]|nr:branched-chain-amino-acid transaminase [Phycisphaerae bacterium]